MPFTFHVHTGVGRLALADLAVGPLHVERLELDVTDLGTDPGSAAAERYQRRRTRLRSLAIRAATATVDAQVEAMRRHLTGLGITQVAARLCDGYVSIRARAADGLAAADVTFRVYVANTGTHLRALASSIRVHGHLPTPAPVIADRILSALLGATDVPGVVERPQQRGLCDVEVDLIGALLWYLLPPAGWRLPAVTDIELLAVRIGRTAIEIAFGPPESRNGDLARAAAPLQLAAAHDLMHSADDQLRSGHVDEAMRGYRALLAAGGPDQPVLLERILALASARPGWFFDGLELARQALGRWPHFPAAHAALASITLAQGARTQGRESPHAARAHRRRGRRRRSGRARRTRRRALAARARAAVGDAALRARTRARIRCRPRPPTRSPTGWPTNNAGPSWSGCYAHERRPPTSRAPFSSACGSPTSSCTSSTIPATRTSSSRRRVSSPPTIRRSTR